MNKLTSLALSGSLVFALSSCIHHRVCLEGGIISSGEIYSVPKQENKSLFYKSSNIIIDTNLKYPEEEMYYNFTPDSSMIYYPEDTINYDSLENELFYEENFEEDYEDEEGW